MTPCCEERLVCGGVTWPCVSLKHKDVQPSKLLNPPSTLIESYIHYTRLSGAKSQHGSNEVNIHYVFQMLSSFTNDKTFCPCITKTLWKLWWAWPLSSIVCTIVRIRVTSFNHASHAKINFLELLQLHRNLNKRKVLLHLIGMKL